MSATKNTQQSLKLEKGLSADLVAPSGLTLEQCQSARLSRDSRFDGRFFVAVKTTGIFCRPICPANLPHEANVEYFANQAQALQADYRPCLRCRPDSAPGSWAWKGVETTFQRAVKLIDQGELQNTSLPDLAARLGISDRYLRQLFQQYLGMSPKQYAQFQQLMFAKQLLHSSNMNIGEIAIASGFNSVRRFNDAFQKKLKLTPSDTRKATRASDHAKGWFRAELAEKNTLVIRFDIDDVTQLKHIVSQIRRLFDLDANIAVIEQHLQQTAIAPLMESGIRIPGLWSPWEAGIRAIFGQQISITAAITVLNGFVENLNRQSATDDPCSAAVFKSTPDRMPLNDSQQRRYFPTPLEVANADLSVLKMPQSRKDTLKRYAEFMVDHFDAPPDEWLALKGIGPWTVSYAKLRGLSQPDCFLSTDLVIKKAVTALSSAASQSELIAAVSPWGSYATFNCWNSQS